MHPVEAAFEHLETHFTRAVASINEAAERGDEFVTLPTFRARSLMRTLRRMGLQSRIVRRNRVRVDIRPLLREESEDGE